MQYIHTQKNIKDSPRKLRLVASLVRNLTPPQALEQLSFINKAAAKSLSRAIKTALSNVHSDGVVFKSLEINEGMKLKRVRAGSRGHANPYKRRFSHIRVILTDENKKGTLSGSKN